MSAVALHDLGVRDMAAGIAEGSLDPAAIVEALLDRIDRIEPRIRAWAHVARDGARREAAARGREAREGRLRGPLHGVPVGVKDVFHADGMPTLANSRTLDPDARHPDFGLVAALKAAGAIILGKCETVEFAGMGVSPETRNPWNTEHTAGGSSSGSGAAVGARMVPAAIGTQTGGSNLRPASYCGVAGFKPSYGATSRRGLLPVSWTLDHPGIVARSALDLPLVLSGMAKRAPDAERGGPALRFALVRGFFFERADADTVRAVENAARLLAPAGSTLPEAALPELFRAHQGVHRIVMNTEMTTYHAGRHAGRKSEMAARHVAAIEAYSLVPATYLLQALRVRRLIRDALAALFDEADILVMPTTPAPAPAGLDSTGDASLLSPWSLVGFPAATVPCGLSQAGLPIGLQLVGPPGGDRRVLSAAAQAEALLGRLDLPA